LIIRARSSHLPLHSGNENLSLTVVMVRARSYYAHFRVNDVAIILFINIFVIIIIIIINSISFFFLFSFIINQGFCLSTNDSGGRMQMWYSGVGLDDLCFLRTSSSFTESRCSNSHCLIYMLCCVLIQFYPLQIYIGNNNNCYKK